MYPSSFEYVAPETLDEALAALDRYGGDGKVLAGGQSLIPVMKLRFAAPSALVDINRIPGLDELGSTRDGGLRIGALVRHRQMERADSLKGAFGVLADAAPQISDPIVRNLGTVCGSVAHADPQGDWGTALLAAGASVEVRGPDGERTIPIDELFVGPFMTTLAPNEIVTGIHVPSPGVGAKAGGTYLKLERKVGDFATVGVGVHVVFADGGTVDRAGIALTAVAPTNVRARAAEDALRGRALDDDAIREAAARAAEAAEPFDDHRGSAEYKRRMVAVLTERGLRTAAQAG